MNLPEPTIDYVRSRLQALENDGGFGDSERATELVFRQWPSNAELDPVIVKAIVLNRAYSTNVYHVWTVARHIHNLGIDRRLQRGDESLIGDIATVEIKGKSYNFYSFATKYCSWHQPEKYQIYDGVVDELLWAYQKQFRFDTFHRSQLREYPRFVQIIDQFRDRFGLTALGRKELDKFLWYEGSEQWKAFNSSSK